MWKVPVLIDEVDENGAPTGEYETRTHYRTPNAADFEVVLQKDAVSARIAAKQGPPKSQSARGQAAHKIKHDKEAANAATLLLSLQALKDGRVEGADGAA